MKTLVAIILLVSLLSLQYALWRDDGSMSRLWSLQDSSARLDQEIQSLEEKNAAQLAEVQDYKYGYDAIEERARSEMGMIAPDETFYQVIYSSEPPVPPLPSPSQD